MRATDPVCRHGKSLLDQCRTCGRPPLFSREWANAPTPRPFELVFSRFSEPVSFLDRWPHAATIYNKGKDDVSSRFPVVNLPNVGMDCQTIFHHLAERYDTLAEVTLFLSGNWTKWRDEAGRPAWANPCLEWYGQKSYDPACPIVGHRFLFDNGWPGPVVHYGKWQQMLDTGEIRPSPYALGEWFDRVVGGQRPARLLYCPGQTFSVAREYVHLRPQRYYARLAAWFGAHRYPEECHHMERVWLHLFRPGGRPDVDLP